MSGKRVSTVIFSKFNSMLTTCDRTGKTEQTKINTHKYVTHLREGTVCNEFYDELGEAGVV